MICAQGRIKFCVRGGVARRLSSIRFSCHFKLGACNGPALVLAHTSFMNKSTDDKYVIITLHRTFAHLFRSIMNIKALILCFRQYFSLPLLRKRSERQRALQLTLTVLVTVRCGSDRGSYGICKNCP